MKLFSSPQLQQVILDGNAFNGTLDLGRSISSELSMVSFKDNDFSSVTVTSSYNGTLALAGNPVCNHLPNTAYCNVTQHAPSPAYTTSLVKCFSGACPPEQSMSPQSCGCAYPYQGVMYFRAPFFADVGNGTAFQELESKLWTKLELSPGSVALQDPFFNSDSYMQVQVKLFPSGGPYFNRTEVMRIGFDLSNQTFKPPKEFGPYYFIASPYPFPDRNGPASKSKGAIIGIAVGCGVLLIALVGAAVYALMQRRRAQKATEELGGPFGVVGSERGAGRRAAAERGEVVLVRGAEAEHQQLRRGERAGVRRVRQGVQGHAAQRAVHRHQEGAARVDAGRARVQDRDRAALPGAPQEPRRPRRLLLRAGRADARLRVHVRRHAARQPHREERPPSRLEEAPPGGAGRGTRPRLPA
ncbi:unnamed protein product [Triticum turgidum subsp. durum]|uniref:Uncharacterized protein n=1 Tax=Triticum turgidum subsp. durum TaxID=4567 RepID=A0A9R0T2Q2_TRITD|nr:unnamed protein product [Triticum turgidum subsp. durum]